ncbi:hypothetical protein BaRGS_00010900 [Batillaria attramentaria]|uniref:Uncharacterized protein n=1 Tax=Batillaria attramentaria TaxID=370345 RepID=A0ABD0LEK5_9CAEN
MKHSDQTRPDERERSFSHVLTLLLPMSTLSQLASSYVFADLNPEAITLTTLKPSRPSSDFVSDLETHRDRHQLLSCILKPLPFVQLVCKSVYAVMLSVSVSS